MKKIVSYILAAIFIATSVLFFNSYFKKAKAATEEEVYNATNTYAVKSIEKNKSISGYSEQQYIVTYEMSNKTSDNIVASNPSVTVFTHGYNSSASDWMNNAEYIEQRSKFDLTYNEHSMVNKVVELYGLDNTVLLVAKMDGYNSFNLFHVLAKENGAIIQKGEKTFNIKDQKFGKHFIIVFESYQTRTKPSNNSNNNLYYQFNYMLSHVLYDIKQIDPAHRIPKVNLIGHSRGGLTNLQYALDHPDIVENLISIGTPYFGSTSISIVQNVDDYKGDGLKDLINPSVYKGYRNTWNDGYENMYSKINAVAIGAYSTLPFLAKVAHRDRSGTINFWGALGIDAANLVY